VTPSRLQASLRSIAAEAVALAKAALEQARTSARSGRCDDLLRLKARVELLRRALDRLEAWEEPT
jgi:hypothetical protein